MTPRYASLNALSLCLDLDCNTVFPTMEPVPGVYQGARPGACPACGGQGAMPLAVWLDRSSGGGALPSEPSRRVSERCDGPGASSRVGGQTGGGVKANVSVVKTS